MTEKFKDYPLDRPLNAARRQKIDRLIQARKAALDRPLSHTWDGPNLTLVSDPVKWTLTFHKERVEVVGSAPFWVKMLFTEKRRAAADALIREVLTEAGLIEPPKAPAAARKKAASK